MERCYFNESQDTQYYWNLIYEEGIPPSNHTTNEEPKGNVGHDVIVFGKEERDTTEDNRSEDASAGERNGQDDEVNTANTRDNAGI